MYSRGHTGHTGSQRWDSEEEKQSPARCLADWDTQGHPSQGSLALGGWASLSSGRCRKSLLSKPGVEDQGRRPGRRKQQRSVGSGQLSEQAGSWKACRLPPSRPHTSPGADPLTSVLHTGSKSYAVLCLVAQSCPTLFNPMDCSPPGSSVHGILQARILEWVFFSSMPSQLRDRTQVSRIAGKFFKSHTFIPIIRGRIPALSKENLPLKTLSIFHLLSEHPQQGKYQSDLQQIKTSLSTLVASFWFSFSSLLSKFL